MKKEINEVLKNDNFYIEIEVDAERMLFYVEHRGDYLRLYLKNGKWEIESEMERE